MEEEVDGEGIMREAETEEEFVRRGRIPPEPRAAA